MIKIELANPSKFLQIKETLTRMGIANNRDKILYQSCHILQKQGELFIVHFKEIMKMDNKPVDISDEDILRTYSIAKTLESWDMLKIVDAPENLKLSNNFKVIKAAQKTEWTLKSKYYISASHNE